MAKLLKWKVFNNFNRCNKMLLQIILQISKSCPYVVIKVQHLPKFLNAVALFSVHNGVKSLMKTEQEGIFFFKAKGISDEVHLIFPHTSSIFKRAGFSLLMIGFFDCTYYLIDWKFPVKHWLCIDYTFSISFRLEISNHCLTGNFQSSFFFLLTANNKSSFCMVNFPVDWLWQRKPFSTWI